MPPKRRDAPLPYTLPPRNPPRPARDDDWFEEMTSQSQIDFAYRDGSEAGFYTLLETVGGGVAMLDFDQDGDLDLFFTGGGKMTGPPLKVVGLPSALYRNDGDWRFSDVSESTDIGDEGFYSHGVAVGDYNRDGYPDLLVTGFMGSRLYRNEQGERFVNVTNEAGIVTDRWATAAAWADVDRDGYLDLYVATYCRWRPEDNVVCTQPTADGGEMREPCAPGKYPGDRDYLWRNRGDGTFEDITQAAGITAEHRGLGVVTADFDDDGWTDIYVANDVDENDLYFGGPNGNFTNEALLAGVAFSPAGLAEGSMGVDVGDVDGDGRIDLFYTNFVGQDNSLYRRIGPRTFLNAADQYGILGVSRQWVGFGTGLADFDGDGWQDVFVANGHVFYGSKNSPYFQPQQLLRNLDGRKFQDISEFGGPYFSVHRAARGNAIGDLDNDGALDLVVVHQNEPVVLLRNRRPVSRWIRLQLRGTTSNPAAIGAKITAPFGDRVLTRWVRSGAGYLSQSDARIVLPMADHTPVSVTVYWPAGSMEIFQGLTENQTHVLVEGEGQ